MDDEGAPDSWKPGESVPGPIQERLDCEAARRRHTRRIFGENLSRLMSERGVTSREVAEALEVTPRTVARWRAGEAMPFNEPKVRALAWLLRDPRTRLTESHMVGRRHPLNHSPDLRRLPRGPTLIRLLNQTELEGFRIEEVGDLELIYP